MVVSLHYIAHQEPELTHKILVITDKTTTFTSDGTIFYNSMTNSRIFAGPDADGGNRAAYQGKGIKILS